MSASLGSPATSLEDVFYGRTLKCWGGSDVAFTLRTDNIILSSDSDNYKVIKEKFKDTNIEKNIDIDKDCKQFKNKLELFDPKAKVRKRSNSDRDIMLDSFTQHIYHQIENKPATTKESSDTSHDESINPRDDCGGADWSPCAICLEEFPPYLILTHVTCSMVLHVYLWYYRYL